MCVIATCVIAVAVGACMIAVAAHEYSLRTEIKGTIKEKCSLTLQ